MGDPDLVRRPVDLDGNGRGGPRSCRATTSGSPKRLHASPSRAASRNVRPLALAAHEQGDGAAEGAGVADGLRDVQHPPVVRLGPRTPEHREELERILQQPVAVVQRWELVPVGAVLPLEPRRAEAALRPPARQHVERGHGLAEVRHVPERDAGDERADRDPLGVGCHMGERHHGLEDVVPRPPDLGNLDRVIHDPDRRESCGLGRRPRSGPAGRRSRSGSPSKANDETWRPNRSRSRSARAGLGAAGSATTAGTGDDGVTASSMTMTSSQPSPSMAARWARTARLWVSITRAGTRRSRCAFRALQTAAGTSNTTANDREAGRSARLEPRPSADGIVPHRVDHGRESTLQSDPHGLFEQVERSSRRHLVRLVLARQWHATRRTTRSTDRRTSHRPTCSCPTRTPRRARAAQAPGCAP